MIDLLINDFPVDLSDEGISILFQRQRTDYTNPTIVRNSFTKTIKLPGTKRNNSIFSNLWKLDRYVNINDVDFVPSKREPFILLKDGNLVEQGYVKLNNIVWNSNTNSYTYEVTLYGELGNLLYGLSYNIDTVTEEVSPLTLADLDFGFNEFRISKDLIDYAWKRLDGDTSTSGDNYKIFDTINFMVSYDGIPQANNFDTKSVWCSVDRKADVRWKGHHYYANQFPTEIVEDNVTYKYISTMLSKMDPDDHYAFMELKKDISPLEMRDLRSYLLRPIINIKKMFEAIGNYINTHYGYTLDMSDPFFNTYDFKSTWMTLSMLYEIDPDVESGTKFTKKQLLSNTSSPASYLISFCKIYGIYLDVDYFGKKLTLTRLPNFFNREKINELKIDLSKEIKITPLSFDKASYTFDYAQGEGEFLKKYKDKYDIQYGSKKVNTGYRFDASTAPYIDNNIYRQGVDSIDQSIYYRYPYFVKNSFGTDVLFTYPVGLMDEANLPTYKLFNVDAQGEIKTVDGEMSPHWYPGMYDESSSTLYVYNVINSGYQFMNVWWGGLRPQVWQDSFPKLQCHSEDNKGVDGKNILVKFSGFRQAKYGHLTSTEDRTFWNIDSYNDEVIDATSVNYLLSDDNPYLKQFIGKNCYYDCPIPAPSVGGSYLMTINRLPAFSRASYLYTRDYAKIPAFYVGQFRGYTITGSSSSVSITKSNTYYSTSVSSSSGRQYSYFSGYAYKPKHRYFIAAAVKTSSATAIKSGNDYAHPDIIDSTLIDSNDLQYSDKVQLIGSIVEIGDTSLNKLTSLSTNNVGSTVSWDTEYLMVYDLTEIGMEDKLTTVDAAIEYFGMTELRVGYSYDLTETLDFGISRELYVPNCTYRKDIGVYNEYWKHYISDVYSVNTRVMECYCFLDNIDKVFREFYYYDNCLWILSKITDWSMETKLCKAIFIKVNDINNYTY